VRLLWASRAKGRRRKVAKANTLRFIKSDFDAKIIDN